MIPGLNAVLACLSSSENINKVVQDGSLRKFPRTDAGRVEARESLNSLRCKRRLDGGLKETQPNCMGL